MGLQVQGTKRHAAEELCVKAPSKQSGGFLLELDAVKDSDEPPQ